MDLAETFLKFYTHNTEAGASAGLLVGSRLNHLSCNAERGKLKLPQSKNTLAFLPSFYPLPFTAYYLLLIAYC
jgi:hypothetical protein